MNRPTFLTRAGLVIVALALGACSATRTQESAGEVIDDSTLTAKVKAALIDDPETKAYQIDVETYNGVVQLSGFVDDRKTAMSAEHVAESVHGVKDVKNDLHVRAP